MIFAENSFPSGRYAPLIFDHVICIKISENFSLFIHFKGQLGNFSSCKISIGVFQFIQLKKFEFCANLLELIHSDSFALTKFCEVIINCFNRSLRVKISHLLHIQIVNPYEFSFKIVFNYLSVFFYLFAKTFSPPDTAVKCSGTKVTRIGMKLSPHLHYKRKQFVCLSIIRTPVVFSSFFLFFDVSVSEMHC